MTKYNLLNKEEILGLVEGVSKLGTIKYKGIENS